MNLTDFELARIIELLSEYISDGCYYSDNFQKKDIKLKEKLQNEFDKEVIKYIVEVKREFRDDNFNHIISFPRNKHVDKKVIESLLIKDFGYKPKYESFKFYKI